MAGIPPAAVVAIIDCGRYFSWLWIEISFLPVVIVTLSLVARRLSAPRLACCYCNTFPLLHAGYMLRGFPVVIVTRFPAARRLSAPRLACSYCNTFPLLHAGYLHRGWPDGTQGAAHEDHQRGLQEVQGERSVQEEGGHSRGTLSINIIYYSQNFIIGCLGITCNT